MIDDPDGPDASGATAGGGSPAGEDVRGDMDHASGDDVRGVVDHVVDGDAGGDDARCLVTVAVLASVIVLALDPGGWFPFSIAKWWMVIVVLLVSGVVWRGSISLRPTFPVVTLAALVGVVALSGAVGLDPHHALLGTPVRHLGVAAWASFLLAYVVGAAIARRGPQAPAVTVASACSDTRAVPISRGVVVAGIALSAYVGWEAIVGRPVGFTAVTDRLGGPFGSPAYLGAMCCLVVPTSVGLVLDHTPDRRWRVVAALSAIGSSVGVVGSGSRAALLALAVSGLVVAVFRVTPSIRRTDLNRWSSVPPIGDRISPTQRRASTSGRRAARASSAARFGIVTMVASIVVVGVAASSGVFERSAGWATRLDEWALALRVIADRPFLGTGPEGYRIAAFALADDDYVTRFGDAVGTDRAHSGVLDVAASSGVAAGVLYAAALAFVCVAAVRSIRRGRAAEIGLAAAVFAYGVGQQFLFPVAEIDPLFWLLAGALCARGTSRPVAQPSDDWPSDHGSHDHGSHDHGSGESAATDAGPCTAVSTGVGRQVARGVAAVVFALLAVSAGVIGVGQVAADRLARDAVQAPDQPSAVRSVEQAVALAPGDLRLRVLLARIESGERTLAATDRAIADIDVAFEQSPLDPVVRIERARLFSVRAEITGDATDRGRAADAWRNLVEDAPSCAQCHLGVALAAGERGDLTLARSELQRAAGLGSTPAADLLDSLADGG